MATNGLMPEQALQRTSSPSRAVTCNLTMPKCTIREYRKDDADSLVHNGNNPNVAKYMSNIFPSPYTLADAHRWIAMQESQDSPLNFAIDVGGACVGGIGLKPGLDLLERTWEIGYWLGEEYWGRGITTQALAGLTDWAFQTYEQVLKLSAVVLDENEGSSKCLRKTGYEYEGRLRDHAFKNGRLYDLLWFGILRREWERRTADRMLSEQATLISP